MVKLQFQFKHYSQLVYLSIPIAGYFIGWKLQNQIDEDLTHFRNKSQLFGGRKQSLW